MTAPIPTSTPDRSRWIALYVLCAGMLMIVLDVTVVNVALPSIQDDLGFTQAGLAWVINAYLIAFAGLLLLAGRVGDLIGRRTVFLGGLAVFTAASVLCGVAQTSEMLVVARFVQGAGGAAASAVILGMIVTMFPEPRDQAKAIGVFGFVASAGGSVGLLAGGIITDAIDWHWIFIVNLPIGVLTCLLAVRLIERDPGIGLRSGADVAGAVLITASLMLGVYTIVEPAAKDGWGDPTTLLLAGISLVLLAAFLARQNRAHTPLMPLGIFRSRNVSGANAVQALSVAGMFGMFFLGALYLERILGYSPLEIGLAFLPATLIMGVLSLRYAEKLIMRFGAKRALLPGLVAITLGLLWFAQVPVDGEYLTDIVPVMVLLGFGGGTSFPALMTLAMSGVKPEEAGLASGVVNTSMEVGGALGLAVLATVSASHTAGRLGEGMPEPQALVDGYQLAFWIAAALLAAATAIAAIVLEPAAAPAHAHGEAPQGAQPEPA